MLLSTIGMAIAKPRDNPTEYGFDEWGYNYRAHQFNGPYCFYDRHYDPDNPDWNDVYCDIHLIMQWSETWLSAEDRDGDGELDRGCTFDKGEWTCTGTSATTGAWLTNHMRGTDENGDDWTYYVEIVYPGYDPVDENGDGLDDESGAPIVWGKFIILKEVSSGVGATLYTQPVGFGAWK